MWGHLTWGFLSNGTYELVITLLLLSDFCREDNKPQPVIIYEIRLFLERTSWEHHLHINYDFSQCLVKIGRLINLKNKHLKSSNVSWTVEVSKMLHIQDSAFHVLLSNLVHSNLSRCAQSKLLPLSNLKKRKQEMTRSVKSLSDYCEIRNTISQLALRSFFSNSVRGQQISTKTSTLITLTEKLLTMWFIQDFCSESKSAQERATCQLYTTRRAWSANPCAWKSIACEQAQKGGPVCVRRVSYPRSGVLCFSDASSVLAGLLARYFRLQWFYTALLVIRSL